MIGPVRPIRTDASLLDTRVNGERKAAGKSSDAQKLPSTCQCLAQRTEKWKAVGVQILKKVERKRILDIEVRRPLVGARIEWILGRGLRHGAGKS